MNISKAMSKAFDFSVCRTDKQVPTGPDWLHEIKYDGYRMIVIRNGDRVRLLTKGGQDWSSRYPFIVETALWFHEKYFVIDGEAVVLDRARVFRLRRPALPTSTTMKFSSMPSICWRLAATTSGNCPLHLRKTNLARLLARRPEGIFLAPFERFVQAARKLGVNESMEDFQVKFRKIVPPKRQQRR
jgi:bifunctional non-homologous end joining protein LigD